MAAKKTEYPWKDKICNPAQLGGIETSVLDNGAGRAVRIAWVNTGSGLRYKVVLDRAMDIADAFFNSHSLAWLSHAGVTSPRPDANHDLEWLYTFGGGLLATCGLTHVGPPETEDGEVRGLHGRIGNCPAHIESVVQPDPEAGKLEMCITGVMKQTHLFGPNYELRRTISSTLGEPAVRIRDTVTNRASQPMPHMILYHCNFGWPLVDEGADIVYSGPCESRGMEMDDEIFKGKQDYTKCRPPLDIHRGKEACGFIDAEPDGEGFCSVGIKNSMLQLALSMRYRKKQLPWLSNWQHWGFGDYVCALEPGTSPPVGQIEARRRKQLIKLAPGRAKKYELEMRVLTGKDAINFGR